MSKQRYNGWSNYETWTVDLWLGNEEGSYRYWHEQAQQHHEAAPTSDQVVNGTWTVEGAARFNLAVQLKQQITEASPLQEASVYSDLLQAALSEVDWYQIAERYLADLPGEPDEAIRRQLQADINAQPGSREELTAEYGRVWNTEELASEFEVQSFLAPFVVVRRRSDGKRGTLAFQHSPRFYFNFYPDPE